MREPNKWTHFFTVISKTTRGERYQFSLNGLTVQGRKLEELPGIRCLVKRVSTTLGAILKPTLESSFCFLGNVHHVTPNYTEGLLLSTYKLGITKPIIHSLVWLPVIMNTENVIPQNTQINMVVTEKSWVVKLTASYTRQQHKRSHMTEKWTAGRKVWRSVMIKSSFLQVPNVR